MSTMSMGTPKRWGNNVRNYAKRVGCSPAEYEAHVAAGEWRCRGRGEREAGGRIAPHWAPGPKPKGLERCPTCKGKR